ncbi:50S ribosomal protein L35ae [Candidatus Woesearchaeota archaeon]|nr:50S ribosomal protein L35ae [Candidatus Woesearchaeota archaeon]
MEATIANFRMSRHRQKVNHMILHVPGVDNKAKAEKLVGKAVSWKSPAGKEIKGKIASAHGNSGAVRAIFETGMPGQSLTTKVKVA